MIEVLTAIGVLGVVVTGILIMVQAESAGDALRFVGRALAVLFLAFFALCGLRFFWTCILIPWLWASFAGLKSALYWLTITLFALIALLLALRLILRQLGRQFTLRLGSQKGDKYDNDHFQDTAH